jgi:hypothetical protein
LVVGGGTALASYVVSSNSQIGRGTVSGHEPPGGKHANIIKESVNGTDIAPQSIGAGNLATSAVTNPKLANGAVSNTKLANGAVTNAKLLGGAVGTRKLADGAVTKPKLSPDSVDGSKVLDGSLTGSDVADNSLGGQQIAESTLGEVPLAQVGGFGRDRYGGSCYPNGAAYVDCVVLTVNLPTRSPVLLIGATEAFPQNGAATGACKLVTQFGDVPNTAADYHLPAGAIVPGSLVGITGLLGPGPVDFGIDCNKFSGTMEYFAHLAALQIAPN